MYFDKFKLGVNLLLVAEPWSCLSHDHPHRSLHPALEIYRIIQPCLTPWQRERQGGIGVAKFFDTKQYGAYTEHRKWAKSLEQPTFTKGVNWCSSSVASCWDSCFIMFGNIVLLYWRPWHSGIMRGSQIPWACDGNSTQSVQITPNTTLGLTFLLTTVVSISALWTVVLSSETLSEDEKKFVCAQFDNRNPTGSKPCQCLISPRVGWVRILKLTHRNHQ